MRVSVSDIGYAYFVEVSVLLQIKVVVQFNYGQAG